MSLTRTLKNTVSKQPISIELITLSSPISKIRNKFERIYGITLSDRQCIEFAVKNAGIVYSRSIDDIVDLFSAYPLRETYRVSRQTINEVEKILKSLGLPITLNYRQIYTALMVIQAANNSKLLDPTSVD